MSVSQAAKKRQSTAKDEDPASDRRRPAQPVAGPSTGATDSRFVVTDDFDLETDEESVGALADDGNDALNPLSKEALLAYQAQADRTGIVYISRIPPGMGPSQVRHLLSRYGELGRVYLKRDEKEAPASKRQKQKHKAHRFVEGWVEFRDKKIARSCAEMLNAAQIGGKKGSRWRDDIWTMKYLPRYKWHMLSEHIAHEAQVQAALLRSHLSQSKRDQANYLEQVERARVQAKKDAKRQAKELAGDSPVAPTKPKKRRAYAQRTVVDPRAGSKASSSALEGVLNSLF